MLFLRLEGRGICGRLDPPDRDTGLIAPCQIHEQPQYRPGMFSDLRGRGSGSEHRQLRVISFFRLDQRIDRKLNASITQKRSQPHTLSRGRGTSHHADHYRYQGEVLLSSLSLPPLADWNINQNYDFFNNQFERVSVPLTLTKLTFRNCSGFSLSILLSNSKTSISTKPVTSLTIGPVSIFSPNSST